MGIGTTSPNSQRDVSRPLSYGATGKSVAIFDQIESQDILTASASGTAGKTVKSAVPIKTAVAKLDTEVTSSDKSTKNVILVGGPFVNTLVAELATAGKTKATQWYLDQGPGTTLVDLVSSAFTDGRSALVVAGYNADDTRTGTGVLQNYDAHASELAGKNTVVWKNGVVSTTAA